MIKSLDEAAFAFLLFFLYGNDKTKNNVKYNLSWSVFPAEEEKGLETGLVISNNWQR